MVVMTIKGLFGSHIFGTFMCNKILDNLSKFQGEMSSCSKVVNKNVVGFLVPLKI